MRAELFLRVQISQVFDGRGGEAVTPISSRRTIKVPVSGLIRQTSVNQRPADGAGQQARQFSLLCSVQIRRRLRRNRYSR